MPSDYTDPVLSPDLQRVAVGDQGDIWLLDLVRGGASRFTVNPANDATPLWSPDGSRIVFHSNQAGGSLDLFVKNSGGGSEEVLVKSSLDKYPEDWSPDGRLLLYTQASSDSGLDLWIVPVTGIRKPERMVHTRFVSAHGRFSPDGRWLAYASNESGRAEVYVQSFPATGSKWPVSTAGGAQPRWRRDGKELLFLSLAGEAMAVDVSTPNGAFQSGTPRKLFQANPVSVFNGRNSWDVTPDGQRFLINSGGAAPPITVVVNWLAGTK